MSNFVYVMAAGVALFVLGGVIAGVTDIPSVDGTPDETETDDAIFATEIGVVGTVEQDFRVKSFDDVNVSYQSPTTTVAQQDELRLTRGAFDEGETEFVSFEAQEPESLTVSFSVAQARPYGDLIVTLNGEEERRIQPEAGRTEEVTFENVTEGENTILMELEGPGYRFWSSTMYDLRDFEVTVEDMAVRKNTKTFRVYEYEWDGFDTGEVRFDVDSAIREAPLTIEINGNQIYERSPVDRALAESTSFTREGTGLSPGENTISFYSQPGAQYQLSGTEMELQFFGSPAQRTVTEEFQLPEAAYRRLGDQQGKISFDVERIGLSREVTVTLNDREYTVTPDSGTNDLFFERGDVSQGTNELSFTTDGNYEISELRVDVGDFETEE